MSMDPADDHVFERVPKVLLFSSGNEDLHSASLKHSCVCSFLIKTVKPVFTTGYSNVVLPANEYGVNICVRILKPCLPL